MADRAPPSSFDRTRSVDIDELEQRVYAALGSNMATDFFAAGLKDARTIPSIITGVDGLCQRLEDAKLSTPMKSSRTLRQRRVSGIRAVVSRRMRRFQTDGFDLNLAYITNRLIAMGLPAEKVESMYRNPIDSVVTFFNTYHKDHFKIYNLCMERNYDYRKFNDRVGIFPFNDHSPPPLQFFDEFCLSLGNWYLADPKNVAAIHCKGGKGRTGTMICAWLLYTKTCATVAEAMNLFTRRRYDITPDESTSGLGVTGPSQIRYLHYWESLLHRGKMSAQKATINTITLSHAPRFDITGGCDLWWTISVDGLVVHDTKSKPHTIKGRNPIVFSAEVQVMGDVQICFYDRDTGRGDEYMFSFFFNTAFLEPSNGKTRCVFELGKYEMEGSFKDVSSKNFDESFTVKVALADLSSNDDCVEYGTIAEWESGNVAVEGTPGAVAIPEIAPPDSLGIIPETLGASHALSSDKGIHKPPVTEIGVQTDDSQRRRSVGFHPTAEATSSQASQTDGNVDVNNNNNSSNNNNNNNNNNSNSTNTSNSTSYSSSIAPNHMRTAPSGPTREELSEWRRKCRELQQQVEDYEREMQERREYEEKLHLANKRLLARSGSDFPYSPSLDVPKYVPSSPVPSRPSLSSSPRPSSQPELYLDSSSSMRLGTTPPEDASYRSPSPSRPAMTRSWESDSHLVIDSTNSKPTSDDVVDRYFGAQRRVEAKLRLIQRQKEKDESGLDWGEVPTSPTLNPNSPSARVATEIKNSPTLRPTKTTSLFDELEKYKDLSVVDPSTLPKLDGSNSRGEVDSENEVKATLASGKDRSTTASAKSISTSSTTTTTAKTSSTQK